MNNPLLEHGPFPAFDRIRPEHVQPAMEQVLADLEQQLAALESSTIGIWEDYARPLEAMQDRLTRTWGAVSHLMGVRNSPELREAHAAVQPRVVAFGLRLAQSESLYRALSPRGNPTLRT
ncbi:MAG: M3 family peptidase, partial [Planctomycetota bacterium]